MKAEKTLAALFIKYYHHLNEEHYSFTMHLPMGFHLDVSISKTTLCTFKTCKVVIHQAAAEAYWADCALRLYGVTVYQNGSCINWKSVFYSGA